MVCMPDILVCAGDVDLAGVRATHLIHWSCPGASFVSDGVGIFQNREFSYRTAVSMRLRHAYRYSVSHERHWHLRQGHFISSTFFTQIALLYYSDLDSSRYGNIFSQVVALLTQLHCWGSGQYSTAFPPVRLEAHPLFTDIEHSPAHRSKPSVLSLVSSKDSPR